MCSEEDTRRILCVGLCCVDIVSVCESYPQEDTDQRSLDYYWQRGGNASNSSSVLALLGANVEFMGTLVKSHEYNFLVSDFQSYGVKIDNCRLHEEGHFRCPVAIIVINKQNASRTIMAALNHLVELEIDDYARLDLQKYKWIHFEGRPTVDTMMEVMNRITKYNASVGPGKRVFTSYEIEKAKRPELMQLMDKVDYVFLSKEFAMDHGYKCKEDAVEGFVSKCRTGGTVICAWGEDGAAAKTQSCDTVTSPIFPPNVLIDTLGAGDTFNAATIYALSDGRSVNSAIEFGCKIAGAKCGMSGNKGLKGLEKNIDIKT